MNFDLTNIYEKQMLHRFEVKFYNMLSVVKFKAEKKILSYQHLSGTFSGDRGAGDVALSPCRLLTVLFSDPWSDIIIGTGYF